MYNDPTHQAANPSAPVPNANSTTNPSPGKVGVDGGVNKVDSLLSTSSALASPHNQYQQPMTNDDRNYDGDNPASSTDGNNTTLSSAALELRLTQLRSASSTLSTTLTQKLATSQSGQNLLHIGSSLSTLPPDLFTLLSTLAPFSADVTLYEESNRNELARIVSKGNDIKSMRRRCIRGRECADMLEDLCCAEVDVERDGKRRVRLELMMSGAVINVNECDEEELDELTHVSSLERAAHTTLHLVQELRSSTAEMSAFTSTQSSSNTTTNSSSSDSKNINSSNSNNSLLPSLHTPLPDDTEKAQLLLKLAPRIRTLEREVVKCLVGRLEIVLGQMKIRKMEVDSDVHDDDDDEGSKEMKKAIEDESLLMIGHCLRGLALLGTGKEAENTFARVAIMPLIRSKISMGRLDEGGSRGECAGLFSLLDDIAFSIASTFGSVLQLSEGIFAVSKNDEGVKDVPTQSPLPMEVDLVTCGVWVPIATALMADTGIRMAIFSPGIASILQANYTALDTFLSELAVSLLRKSSSRDCSDKAGESGSNSSSFSEDNFESLYFQPIITNETIKNAQSRIYQHEKTTEFAKKWNLPIYYQLRFGECCTRLNKALVKTQRYGWNSNVFTGADTLASDMRHKEGFELSLFLELYDILLSLWKADVILRPLTHRFLRGAVQLLGRTIAFVKDGLEGSIKFGEDRSGSATENGSLSINGDASKSSVENEYHWGDRVDDVASVAWELTLLETCITHDYLQKIVSVVAPSDVANQSNMFNTEPELTELRAIISDVLVEASQEINPMIHKCWNEVIAGILTKKCSAPLSAVKGVAATYRMTNRPPPTQHSPFVSTILRPLKEFDAMFANRTPPQVGMQWKVFVVTTVSARYSVAVEELLATVQRTEVTLKSRKARRTAAGGMSDGEKVKLQLYLDYKEFAKNVEEVGVDGTSIPGVVKLESSTKEAESFQQKNVGDGN